MGQHRQFKIELEQEDDGRWIGEVPALLGVMAYGSTRGTGTGGGASSRATSYG